MMMDFPVVKFTTSAGKEITFQLETGDSGDVSRYSVGQRLGVRYDPEGAFRPMMDSWSGVWLPNMMAVFSGLVFLFGSYLIYFAFGDRIFAN
jgi:hypothetical protein